jgi:hypothetical protein
MEYRFEQKSEPHKIKFENAEKTRFKCFNATFEIKKDTIWMYHKDSTIVRYVKYTGNR